MKKVPFNDLITVLIQVIGEERAIEYIIGCKKAEKLRNYINTTL